LPPAGELRRILDGLQTDVAAQALQLSGYKAVLKKLARAAAVSLASRHITAPQLSALYKRFPVLRVLAPGAVLSRYLPKGIILK